MSRTCYNCSLLLDHAHIKAKLVRAGEIGIRGTMAHKRARWETKLQRGGGGGVGKKERKKERGRKKIKGASIG